MLRPKGRSRFKKSFPGRLYEIARDKGVEPGRIELWFADEARVGQKNKITRRWAQRGTRPSAPYDQRTASTYIFGAIYRPAMAGQIDGGVLRQMMFRWPERSSQRAHRSGRSGTLQNACRLGFEAVIPSRKAKSSKPEWRTGSKSNAVSSSVLSK